MGLVAGSRKTTHAHQTSGIYAAQTLLYFSPVPVKERVSDETTLIRRCVKGDVDAYGVTAGWVLRRQYMNLRLRISYDFD